MRNLLSCVLKDLRIFGRSKVSHLITVVVPLLIVLLVGTAFSSTSLQGIKVGVYSSSYNDLTNSILQNLEEKSFFVSKLENKDSCISSVKQGDTQICVVFPPDLSTEGNAENVDFFVDTSRANLASLLVEEIKSEISSKSVELGQDLVDAIVDALQKAKTSLADYKTSVDNAKNQVGTISTKANSGISALPDYNSVINELGDAKEIANSLDPAAGDVSGLLDGINEVLTELDQLEDSNSYVDQQFSDIKATGNTISASLTGINTKIDSLLSELNDVKVIEAETIVSPIKMQINSLNAEATNSNFLYPTVLSLMVLFASSILTSVLVLREKKTKAYFRNFITPTSDFTFIFGMYLTSLIILIFQLAVLFSGLVLITGLPFVNVIGSVTLILFISATTFIFMGMVIGYVFRSEEAAILVSISLVSLMMFFSNTILPIEAISARFQSLALYNPLVLSNSMLKKIILFNSDLISLWPEALMLAGAFLVFFILTFVFRKVTKRMF